MDGLQDPIFPKQAIADSQKNTKWYKENIETGYSLTNYTYEHGLRANKREKISNINIVNNIIDKKEIQDAINPYNLSGKYPDTYKNYPIMNSNLNLLFGEERKRIFNPISYVVNSDISNVDQDVVSEKFKQFIQKQVSKPEFNEDQVKKAVMSLDKWRKFTYQDTYERMSNQVIQYFLNTTDIREQWSKCYEDLITQAEEIASIDIVGENLVFEKLNPLDVTTFRSGDSYRVEDADWIIIAKYMTVGEIVDSYHSYLSKGNKDYLEEIYTSRTSGSKGFPDGQIKSSNWNINDSLEFKGIDGKSHSVTGGPIVHNRDYDDQGNVRVIRVLWKGQRKIGILEWVDEEGLTQKKYVDERYKPNKDLGEKIKWEYISEWYEGTKIGADIYVKYGPRPIQFRDPDNPSLCHPGIVGNILNTNSSKAKSLVSYMKPYQLLYNFFMYRMQQDVMKYQGHVAKMNLTMKPSKWSTDKWMYYMQQFGIMYEDPFNEGVEGAAQGKLSGGMPYNSGGSVQIGDSSLIQMNMMMLEFLENRIADISGVSPQRKGAVQNRETVGGVERSVMQSSNNTEKYFSLHDNFKLRCLRTIVETAKIAWKDKKEKRTFVLDDGTKSILDFDGNSFKQGVYGVATQSSSDVTNMMSEMKALSQPYMQNGGSLASIIDIYSSKDPASLKRKLEQFDEETQMRAEESEKRQLQVQQDQIASVERARDKEMAHEISIEEIRANNKLEVELLKQGEEVEEDNSLAIAESSNNKIKAEKDLQLKKDQLAETKRHNMKTEQISASRPKNSTK